MEGFQYSMIYVFVGGVWPNTLPDCCLRVVLWHGISTIQTRDLYTSSYQLLGIGPTQALIT